MSASKLVAAIAGVVVAAGLILLPSTASAVGDPTTTTFEAGATQTASYGSNWVMKIQVAGKQSYDTVYTSSGTISVVIKGIPGYFATGIPVADNGEAFFAQPSGKATLAAGTYTVTAVYVPNAGAFLTGSQTTTPATLTITPIDVATSFTVNQVLVDNAPALRVVATATAKSTGATVPAGQWTIAAQTSSGQTAFSKIVATPQNPTKPVTVTLPKSVKPGDYTVSADFAPAAAVAGGYTVDKAASRKATLAAPSLVATLATPFAAPLWALIAVGAGFALLIATTIVLLVRRRPTAKTAPGDGGADATGDSASDAIAEPSAPPVVSANAE